MAGKQRFLDLSESRVLLDDILGVLAKQISVLAYCLKVQLEELG